MYIVETAIKAGLFRLIFEEAETTPNNMDLGAKVRTILNDYKEGKYNPQNNDLDFIDERS